MKLLAVCLAVGLMWAQSAPVPPAAPVAPAARPDTALGGVQQPDGIRGVMTPSLDKQKESVRKQVKTAQPVEPGWFTVPWPSMQWTEPVKPAAGAGDGSGAGTTTSAGWRPDCDPVPEGTRESLFQRAAAQQGIDVGLIREVARKESAFFPCAVSGKGAVGLMQLMPETAAAMGVGDPFDPEANVFAGAKMLSALLGRYKGDARLALAAYNAGSGRVEDYGGVPPFRETRDYVGKILEALGSAYVGASQ